MWGDIKSMMNYRIDEDVKLIWELLNLSQKQFAERIGVDAITVERWEAGKMDTKESNIEKNILLHLIISLSMRLKHNFIMKI